jgi:DNA-binding transcriptional LysR family regulator
LSLSIMEPDRLLGVELRHLAALQAVAEEGSFGRAALRLGYTQSAISQQIATLERLVGEQLVERPGGPRAVSLTEAGALLLRHAQAIMARLAAAQADLAALAEGAVGSLRIGTYQSVGARILPGLLRRFRESWSRVEIKLSESNSDPHLLELVERGELDLAFAMQPLPDGPFECVELLTDPYVLLVQADSPLARRERPPKLAEVAELPLIVARQCRSLYQVEAHFESRGLTPRVVFNSDDNGTVHGLVAAGVGAALVPLLAVDPQDERTRILGLDSDVPPRVITLAWHRDRYRSPAARAVLEEAARFCEELSGELAPEVEARTAAGA